MNLVYEFNEVEYENFKQLGIPIGGSEIGSVAFYCKYHELKDVNSGKIKLYLKKNHLQRLIEVDKILKIIKDQTT